MTGTVLVGLLLSSPAHSADIYINGVRTDRLPEGELTSVDLRVDAAGNLWIEAPQYRVEVVDDVQQAPARAVPQGRYWLVTEDQGSSGHVVDVVINGTLVRKIRSGEEQLILDLAPHLRPGANAVLLNAMPSSAGGGGPLGVYIGTGANVQGTVRLDRPEISLTRTASEADRARSERFSLTVR